MDSPEKPKRRRTRDQSQEEKRQRRWSWRENKRRGKATAIAAGTVLPLSQEQYQQMRRYVQDKIKEHEDEIIELMLDTNIRKQVRNEAKARGDEQTVAEQDKEMNSNKERIADCEREIKAVKHLRRRGREMGFQSKPPYA